MKYLKDFELITESDTQTYRKLQFIREQIRNITKTIRDIDWRKTTDGEVSDIRTSLDGLSSLINRKSKYIFEHLEERNIKTEIEKLLYDERTQILFTHGSWRVYEYLTDNILNDKKGDFTTTLSFSKEVKDGRSLKIHGPEIEKIFLNKKVEIDGKTIRIKDIKFIQMDEQESDSDSRYYSFYYNITFEIK